MNTEDDTASAYEDLTGRLREIYAISQTRQLLNWDRLVTMPAEGTPIRNQQQSTINSVMKEKLTDDRMGELLERIDTERLDDREKAVVREARRRYEKNVNTPSQIEIPLRKRLNKAGEFWKRAEQAADFTEYTPLLDEVRQLQHERASHLDSDGDTPAVLFENKHSYVDVETADRIFDHLLDELVPLRDELLASRDESESVFEREAAYPEAKQEELNRKVLDILGYDWNRGRLDTAPHAFSCGHPYDVRITTQYDEDDPTKALLTTLHEFGHAAYTFGLPEDDYGTPLGKAMDGPVHESQSLFWENHVGRSREFWELVLPELADTFPELDDVTVDEAYETVNRTYEEGVTYVAGNEITQHINTILRHRMERRCYEIDDLDRIPAVVADEMEDHLDVRPEGGLRFRNAPWPKGFFGFETYTLGAVVAAQLHATVSTDIDDFDERIRRGEFETIRNWFVENVYRHGQRYTTPELVEQVTGEELDPEYYVDYVKEKYSRLYDV